jgi:uncharacterized membrane protein (UPF0127 family)
MNEMALAAVVLLIVLTVGCNDSAKEPTGSVPSPAMSTDPGEPTQAQPKLRTMRLYIGAKEMLAELALKPQEIRTGMMFRTNMEAGTGMLFALPYTQRASFWMKNCPYPLSAAFIDEEGIIQEIHKLEPHNTNSVVAASENIRFVLETPRGWFEQNGIAPGVAIATERGPLYKTFFGGH